jgi:glutamyl-tRNA synthetase
LKENQTDWKKMLSVKESDQFKEGEAVIRFKTSMQEKNPAFRDFPLARINDALHPRQGHKFRVWPLMNLAVTVDDIELKITHVIRAVEHKDNAKKQEMIFKVLGKKYPWDAYVGLYDFPDLELSATKITKGIESGEYSGWDDLRLPTIAALKKKGYKPEAFWGISIRSGLTESNKKMTRAQYFELLDYFNSHPEEVKL